MIIQNESEKLQFFWSHSSVFALEKQSKNLNFQSFLPLRDPLLATFDETRAPPSGKYVAEKDAKLTKITSNFLSHSSVFA